MEKTDLKVKDADVACWGKQKNYTYQDYLDLPEVGLRYEIIEGELIMVAAPYTFHQVVSRNIAFDLLDFIEKHQPGQEFYTPCDVVLLENNVVQPDILFIANENSKIITEKNISGAPDLIIDILSHSTAYNDLVEKKKLYAEFQIKEYWIVDLKKKWIEIYSNHNQKFELAQKVENEGIAKSVLLDGWQIDLKQVFKF